MGEDEAGTALRGAGPSRSVSATPIVRGFITAGSSRRMGDGASLEFPSVSSRRCACAIRMQQQMAERNAGVPEARRILYRIGVNLGDVLDRRRGYLWATASISQRGSKPSASRARICHLRLRLSIMCAAGSRRSSSTSARRRSRTSPGPCGPTRLGSPTSPARNGGTRDACGARAAEEAFRRSRRSPPRSRRCSS